MFNYRAHVHGRYVIAMAAALSLRRTFLEWQAATDTRPEELVRLREGYAELTSVTEALLAALPDEVLDNLKGSGRQRHLAWMKKRLDEGKPGECISDAVDLTDRDLPLVWSTFDAWFRTHSWSDEDFVRKTDSLLNIGQYDSAVRKAWAVFKSRLVAFYGVSADLDGHKLVDALFGPNGVARGRISNVLCEGYFHLLKGLYALHRNEITHNDVAANPQEVEGVLMLLNSTLARLTAEGSQS